MRPDILILSGPTASGKSGAALTLAERLDGIIINADALQVYAEMRVLTARPSVADEARMPHHLYGHRSVLSPYAVTDWLRDVAPVIATAWHQNRLPIVVGGTGFYLQTLLHGMSPVPDVPAPVRQQAMQDYDRLGHDAFRAALAQVDPSAAATIASHDRQRLVRAMEVHRASGTPLSHWQRQPRHSLLPAMRSLSLLLMPPRDVVYARIDQRFLAMLAHGAWDEARAVDRLQPDPALPGCKALGLQPLRDALHGRLAAAEAVTRGQTTSRHYAKRQTTWLRTQWRDTDQHAIRTYADPADMLQDTELRSMLSFN